MTLNEAKAGLAAIVLAIALCIPVSAAALTVEVVDSGPSLVGEAHAFKAVVSGATGAIKYQWRFGDADDYQDGDAELTHTFAAPGHYNIDVFATAENGDAAGGFVQHLVHNPITPRRPTASTSIVYDAARKRVYSVNQDNDTLTAIDAAQLTKVAELPVYRGPEALAIAPDGKLWVVHKDDYAVAVVNLDSFTIERGFRLPYASQPVGIAMSPTGDAAYVTLMAVGRLLKLDPATGMVLAELDVGPRPRGIAVSHDGRDVYVTRFISSDEAGEVVKVDAASMQVGMRIPLRLDSETVETPQAARGVPNYLFSIALTPDGRQAWIPGKKDNILRGKARDGQALTHDSTVRPLIAVVDAQANAEALASRMDLDDRSLPVHVEFTPLGDFAIITLAGSNRVEIRDVNRPTQVFSAISKVGAFPRASVLAPDGRLFVQGSLSRDVLVYDLSALLQKFDASTPSSLKAIAAVATEKLSATVLTGKKTFHDSSDERMANEGYLSCGVCHFEGIDDGRVYDFSDRGEGLRNTVALLARAGTKQGPLNWTGNLDEVQDFEHQMRELFGGKGFLADAAFHTGARDQPLGDHKAGLSPELDALAAYVSSLEHVNPSPYRNPDGSLTPDGMAGKTVFARLGCDFCHGGSQYTDSAPGLLHDVGTLTPQSGQRAGAPLLGIDTPTLLGVWETPPYLHDGSAATLRDVLTTRNSSDLHGYVSALSPPELEQLLAYVQQLDGDQAIVRLPFEPPVPQAGAGAGGQSGAGGQGGAAAAGQSPVQGGAPPAAPQKGRTASCTWRTTSSPGEERGAGPLLALLSMIVLRRGRGRSTRAALVSGGGVAS